MTANNPPPVLSRSSVVRTDRADVPWPLLEVTTPWSRCTVSPHGAQVLSFVPHGAEDLFWMSPAPLPPPRPIRGGVPLCWPWFARQGVAAEAPQHGVVRTVEWACIARQALPDGTVRLTLRPEHPPALPGGLRLQPTLELAIGETLEMRLETVNAGDAEATLTQAFHNYLAVSDLAEAELAGLEGTPYVDNLEAGRLGRQRGRVCVAGALERIHHDADGPLLLGDRGWKRRLRIETGGSRSVVLWNPGPAAADTLPDAPGASWRRFVCIEVANAGPDQVTLRPGASHCLVQRFSLEHGQRLSLEHGE